MKYYLLTVTVFTSMILAQSLFAENQKASQKLEASRLDASRQEVSRQDIYKQEIYNQHYQPFIQDMQIEEVAPFAEDLPYLDENIGCTESKKAQQYISDFNIDIQSFGKLELCNSKIDTKKLLNDLALIEQGKFVLQPLSDSDSHLKDNRNISNDNNTIVNLNKINDNNLIRNFIPIGTYYAWAKAQVRGVARGNDIPYATAYNSSGYFTMQDGWAKLSTLGRVGTFIHEARHTAGYRHIPCNQGPYNGLTIDACDTTYEYGGSHAIEMEYYARVAVQGENFHPVYKTMARLMAMARANFVFNRSPIKVKEGLLLLNNIGQSFLVDNGKRFVRETPNVIGRLKRTSFGAVMFDGARAYTIEMYKNSGFNPLITDVYSYFKILLRGKEEFADVEEFDSNNTRNLVKISKDGQYASYSYAAGDWYPAKMSGFKFQSSKTTLPNGEKGYFVVDNSQKIYPFDIRKKQFNAALNYTWPNDYLGYEKYQNQLFALKQDGKIYSVDKNNQETQWSDNSEQFVAMTSVPLYDAFEVSE